MREYHVAVTGCDSNSGTKDQPFRTISRAASLAMPGDRVIVPVSYTHLYYDLGNMTEEDNMELLTNAGCDVIQGYLFAKPMPKEAFEAMPGSTDHLSMNHREQGG